MDKIDKIIITELAYNCRQASSKIAKKIKKSPQFTKYRLDKLKQNQINKIPLFLNFYNLGYQEITGLIKFTTIDPISEKKVIDYLIKRMDTYKVIYIEGEYNILFSIITKKMNEIENIKNQLLNITQLEISWLTNYYTEIYPLNYFSEHKYNQKIIIEKTNKIELTNNEIKILSEFIKNPLSTILEISQKVNYSYDQIIYAIKNKKNIIGNTIVLNNVERFIILLKTKKEIKEYSLIEQHIKELNKCIGDYDSYIIIEAEKDIHQHIKRILYSLKKNIVSYKKLRCTHWYKYGWYGL